MYFIDIQGNSTFDPFQGYIHEEELSNPQDIVEAINRLIERQNQYETLKTEFQPESDEFGRFRGRMVVSSKAMTFVDDEWMNINAVRVMTLDQACKFGKKAQRTKKVRHG